MKEKDFENAVIFNGRKFRIRAAYPNQLHCDTCAFAEVRLQCHAICAFYSDNLKREEGDIFFEEVKE